MLSSNLVRNRDRYCLLPQDSRFSLFEESDQQVIDRDREPVGQVKDAPNLSGVIVVRGADDLLELGGPIPSHRHGSLGEHQTTEAKQLRFTTV